MMFESENKLLPDSTFLIILIFINTRKLNQTFSPVETFNASA